MTGDLHLIRHSQVSDANVAFYREAGYLVAPSLFTHAEVDAIYEETCALFRGDRGAIGGLVEMPPGAPPSELLAAYNAVHFPHKVSETILDYVRHSKLTGVLTRIVGPNVKCMQSMLFVKAPGKPGQSWHQDEYFIPTRDRSLTGAWIAVDDAAVENGCLWVLPGSHREGYIRRRVPYDGDQYADVDVATLDGLDEADAVPVEVERGSVIFFHGYLLHSSLRNTTQDRTRIALVNHYMSAESILPWAIGGRVEGVEDLRDIVLVAGTDPYAWKGTTDVITPFLRPDVLTYKND